ncbi:RING finger 37 [Paramuricea clavata]|uniref:RING finger 37 n=1 Tax=Paramuricea clavata TaxID=317549 RepID=A0A6S7H7H2_PARCT|nr:RING finger 37 [Paramuricea clavata]
MITDFCNALWDTRIESDTISSDGYEVCNLISRDGAKKQRGFLAERFVKPVISILISFPFPIDVCAINVNPQVGGQKICGLEILSASLKYCNVQNKKQNINGDTIKSTLNSEAVTAKSNDHVFHSYQHVLNVNNIKQEFNSFFNQILRTQLAEGKVGHFLNPCFRDAVNADFNSRITGSSPSNSQICNLQQGNQLHNTSHLWIRITQVHKGSVPCLGALEVVGKPAKNNNEFVMNYARFITLRLKQERENCKGLVNASTETNLSANNACKSERATDPCHEPSLVDNVPSEFVDPITFNIMPLPILLPSGNTIDNSTLEKHIAMERNFGRQPCDPFTGIPLGSNVVPNAALKYRIDNFLLSADIKVDELGRTVGSSSDCKSTARLKFDAILKQDKNKIQPVGKRKACPINLKQPPLKKQNAENDGHISGKPNSLDEALENVLSVGQKPTNTPSVKASSLVPSSSLHHNESGPRNIQFTNSGNPDNEGCVHQEQTDTLFRLPCQHVICRQCLTCAVQMKQCLQCQVNFEKKDVVRVHCRRTLQIETV